MENAYTIENMTKALNILKKDDEKASSLKIKITDKYVRFLPKDTAEYNILYNEGLILIDHPLLYEIEENGHFYHDPEIPEGEITWLYAVVTADFVFPNMKYEILSDLYLPFTIKKTAPSNLKQTLIDLEVLALKQVGINKTPIHTNKTAAINASYSPKARITVATAYNGIVSNEPIKGVKIVAYHIFNFATKTTDLNGKVVFNNNFIFPVQYGLIWETKQFKLSFGLLSRYILGPVQSGSWNLNIVANSTLHNLRINCAMVYLAAYDFIYTNMRGPITKPVRSGFVTDIVVDNVNVGRSNAWFANINIIILFTLHKTEISNYITAIHELAHMSHSVGAQNNYNILGVGYSDPLKAITLESWATGVEWYICRNRYLPLYSHSKNNEITLYTKTSPTNPILKKRTNNQVVYDLIDTTNEGSRDVTSAYIKVFLDKLTGKPLILKYIEENNNIYYMPPSIGSCPLPNTYLAPNGYCYLTTIPNDHYTYAKITNNGYNINIITWNKPPLVLKKNVLPFDRVSGYNIAEIQEALHQSKNWNEWKDNLINNATNNSNAQYVNQLFKNWH